jgi:urease accessory protein
VDRARAAVREVSDATDDRTASDVGRKARLELAFGVRNGRTVLTHGYAEPPLRTGRPFQEGDGLHLILASSAPGLFGGDTMAQTVQVESGATVRLTSQSAMQLHPSPEGTPVVISSTFDVAAGATLSCAWDPSIPFAGVHVRQRIEIAVAAGGRLWWSDAMMSGREGRGERWQFGSFGHELRVRRAGALAYLERYRLDPAVTSLTAPWIADDAGYTGTVLRAGYEDSPATAEAVHRALAVVDGVHGSADVLDDDLLLVRLVAATGVPFHRARHTIRTVLTR